MEQFTQMQSLQVHANSSQPASTTAVPMTKAGGKPPNDGDGSDDSDSQPSQPRGSGAPSPPPPPPPDGSSAAEADAPPAKVPITIDTLEKVNRKIKELETVKVGTWPTAPQFVNWRQALVNSVVTTSCRGLKVFRWMMELEAEDAVFDDFVVEEGDENENLDAKLRTGVIPILKGEHGREITNRAEAMRVSGGAHPLMAGRQYVFLIYKKFNLDAKKGAHYELENFFAIRMQNGDKGLRQFKNNWDAGLTKLGNRIPGDGVLEAVLLRQVEGSPALKFNLDRYYDADVGHSDRSYTYLYDSRERFLNKQEKEQNAAALAAAAGGRNVPAAAAIGTGSGIGKKSASNKKKEKKAKAKAQSATVTAGAVAAAAQQIANAIPAAAAASAAKAASTTPAKAVVDSELKKQGICIKFVHGNCTFGDTCKFKHPEAANRVLTPPSKGRGKDKSDGICKYFKKGTCTAGAHCKYKHPDKTSAAPAQAVDAKALATAIAASLVAQSQGQDVYGNVSMEFLQTQHIGQGYEVKAISRNHVACHVPVPAVCAGVNVFPDDLLFCVDADDDDLHCVTDDSADGFWYSDSAALQELAQLMDALKPFERFLDAIDEFDGYPDAKLADDQFTTKLGISSLPAWVDPRPQVCCTCGKGNECGKPCGRLYNCEYCNHRTHSDCGANCERVACGCHDTDDESKGTDSDLDDVLCQPCDASPQDSMPGKHREGTVIAAAPCAVSCRVRAPPKKTAWLQTPRAKAKSVSFGILKPVVTFLAMLSAAFPIGFDYNPVRKKGYMHDTSFCSPAESTRQALALGRDLAIEVGTWDPRDRERSYYNRSQLLKRLYVSAAVARSYIADTGSGKDLLAWGNLTEIEKANVVQASDPVLLSTANAVISADNEVNTSTSTLAVCEDGKCTDLNITAIVLNETPSVLSVGIRTMLQGYDFIWRAATLPFFHKDGVVWTCTLDNLVPILSDKPDDDHYDLVALPALMPPPIDLELGNSNEGQGSSSSSASLTRATTTEQEKNDETEKPLGDWLPSKRQILQAQVFTIVHMLTHLPKNPFCSVCNAVKATAKQARRRDPTVDHHLCT